MSFSITDPERGRIVAVAATHSFRRVLGVELLPELTAIAEENLRRAARKLRCRDVGLVTANATQFRVPPDVTVIFLFNPFMGPVLAEVQQRIRESLDEHPRRLQLVYMNPADEVNLFEDCDWLVESQRLHTGRWASMRFVLYQHHDSK